MQRYRRALHFYLLIFLELTLSTSTLAEERSSARPSSEHTLQSLCSGQAILDTKLI